MARLLYYNKEVFGEFIREGRIWEVSRSEKFPEGIKYIFVLVYGGRRILGYDNNLGEGHHRHFKNEKLPLQINSAEEIFRLLENFTNESNNIIKSKGDGFD